MLLMSLRTSTLAEHSKLKCHFSKSTIYLVGPLANSDQAARPDWAATGGLPPQDSDPKCTGSRDGSHPSTQAYPA